MWALEPLAAYGTVENGFMLGEPGSALRLAGFFFMGQNIYRVKGQGCVRPVSYLFLVQHLRADSTAGSRCTYRYKQDSRSKWIGQRIV